jgi:hypothetical protein
LASQRSAAEKSLRQFAAPADYNWRGSDDHALSGIVWYPAAASPGEEKDQYVGPPDTPLFYAGAPPRTLRLPRHSEDFH